MNSAVQTLSREAFEMANLGQHKKALKLMEEFPVASDLENRIVGHTRAEILMLKGEFSKALELLKQTRTAYGDNLCLIGDIVYCYYSLSDFKKWSFTFNELKALFGIYAPLLSEDRRNSVQLTIAKFLEEEGRIKGSLDEYTNLLALVNEETNLKRYYRILCQSFRVLTTFGNKSNMAQTYTLLETISRANSNLHTDVDVQQCLILGEVSLVGVDVAFRRLKEVFSNPDISRPDKRLLLYDFVEECLAQNRNVPEKASELIEQINSLNIYEQCIHEIAFCKSDQRLMSQLHRLGSQVSFSCYLRLLGLALVRHSKTELGSEIKRKFKLAIDSLDQGSRNLWIQRYRQFLTLSKVEIYFDQSNANMRFADKEINLSRKEVFVAVISALIGQQKISTETLISQIWKRSYSDSDYRSLRMTIHRLNTTLFELTGTPKLIEIGKQEIKLKNICTLIANTAKAR